MITTPILLNCSSFSPPVIQQCQNDLEHALPLHSHLIKPVQRILKYHLMLRVCCLHGLHPAHYDDWFLFIYVQEMLKYIDSEAVIYQDVKVHVHHCFFPRHMCVVIHAKGKRTVIVKANLPLYAHRDIPLETRFGNIAGSTWQNEKCGRGNQHIVQERGNSQHCFLY